MEYITIKEKECGTIPVPSLVQDYNVGLIKTLRRISV